MTYIANNAKNPQGQQVEISVSGNAAFTTDVLSAGGKYGTGWISTVPYSGAETTLYSDADGSYVISYSQDGGQTISLPPVTVTYQSSGGTRKGQFPVNATWVKFDYTNGDAPQNKFLFKIDLLTQVAQSSAETLNAAGSDTRTAQWTKTRIETKTSDATNDYAPVYRSGNALRVFVDNQMTNSPTDVSALAKDATLKDGSTKVQVTNIPSTQSVSVSNFPASQPVSVGNFPSNQVVTGPLTDTQLRASSVPVTNTPVRPSVPTVTSLTTTSTASTVLAANANRFGVMITCVTGTVYLQLGTTASLTNYTVKLTPGAYYELPMPVYTGALSAIGAGTLNVTEVR